jgi:hypothetical protein
MSTALLCADLVVSSKISAAAARCDMELVVAPSADSMLTSLADKPVSLAIIDLSCSGGAVESIVPRLRGLATPPKFVIAFGPHVHEQLLAAAAAAGCDRVLSRGQMIGQAEAILDEYARG